MSKINVEIECKNIAPLIDLKKSIQAGSLKYGIFANNGSGKTFMSRMFRLTEKNEDIELDEDGKCPTDKLITKGKDKGNFIFKIAEPNGDLKEEISISLEKGVIPSLPDTKYIYHTFNQDYVEENIKSLNFEKDSDIEGFILGKINIDLEEEETLLSVKIEENENLTKQIASEIDRYVNEKIKPIRDINRIKEYKLLTPKNIFDSVNADSLEVLKPMNELVSDYNKIKSVPETLAKIRPIEPIKIDFEFLEELVKDCEEEFALSKIAEEFKNKVKSKQPFIESGLGLIHKDTCPFCEQVFDDNAAILIGQYNEYLQDREAVTLKRFESYALILKSLKTELEAKAQEVEKRILEFDSYKTKYIPSLSGESLSSIDLSLIYSHLDELRDIIHQQQKNISISINVEKDYVSIIEKSRTLVNGVISDNNELINSLNQKIDKISDESLLVRREICKSAYNHLINQHKTNLENIAQLRVKIANLKIDIGKKKELQKISKREKVAETIKNVLAYFFDAKYSLDTSTFRLIFKEDVLEKNEANHVLSDGEKTIVAFAYYIGDVHLKINTADDYEKLFFIIDDPISSMDFDHVYTLCGVIRDIKQIIDNMGNERLFIFTHNTEFMRVLSHHRIVNTRLILKNSKLSKFPINSTAPYINHLLDIYKIAKRVDLPSHTTANSIRHVVETLTKFDRVVLEGESIKNFLAEKLPVDKRSCILINDLSHGGYRTEQSLITEDEYIAMCDDILTLVSDQFGGQIKYCEKIINE